MHFATEALLVLLDEYGIAIRSSKIHLGFPVCTCTTRDVYVVETKNWREKSAGKNNQNRH